MFSYEPFWKMLSEKGISTYDLEYTYHLNKSEIHRLKHDHNFNIGFIDHLCTLFDCRFENIVTHVSSDPYKKNFHGTT